MHVVNLSETRRGRRGRVLETDSREVRRRILVRSYGTERGVGLSYPFHLFGPPAPTAPKITRRPLPSFSDYERDTLFSREDHRPTSKYCDRGKDKETTLVFQVMVAPAAKRQ